MSYRLGILSAILCGLLLVAACNQSSGESSPSTVSSIDTVAAQAPGDEGEPARQDEEMEADSPSSADRSILEAILDSYSTKEFLEGDIDSADLTAILEAGLKAPSARNLQPWHFSVVTDIDKITPYVQSAREGNALVIVSGTTEEEMGVNVSLDCGLAAENIYMAAQALGYGAHMYAAPVSSMNQDKAKLGIPDDHDALVAILISRPTQAPDAVSGASVRNPFSDMVTFVD